MFDERISHMISGDGRHDNMQEYSYMRLQYYPYTCNELLPLLSNSRPSSSIHEQATMANSSSFSSVDIDLRDSLLTCNRKGKLSKSYVQFTKRSDFQNFRWNQTNNLSRKQFAHEYVQSILEIISNSSKQIYTFRFKLLLLPFSSR